MIEICVCIGSACHLKGSYNVMQDFQQMVEEYSLHDQIILKSAFCMRECDTDGVAVSIDGLTCGVPPASAREFFKASVLPAVHPHLH